MLCKVGGIWWREVEPNIFLFTQFNETLWQVTAEIVANQYPWSRRAVGRTNLKNFFRNGILLVHYPTKYPTDAHFLYTTNRANMAPDPLVANITDVEVFEKSMIRSGWRIPHFTRTFSQDHQRNKSHHNWLRTQVIEIRSNRFRGNSRSGSLDIFAQPFLQNFLMTLAKSIYPIHTR